ncbi:hypothetical protein L6452_40477 [Arctium lappa]|uniref:Uncharacterized protein n=1 Tax=Arctium lappa TaxID=4217 RepID=A0ACB8XMK6_ARCLA|nr:hypothetical protein L6452_40477 [Arctium lappa]
MGKQVKYDDSDDEAVDEVMHLTEKDFITKMDAMMIELQDLQTKLKKEKDRVAKRNNKIFELNKSVIGNNDLIDYLRESASDFKNQVDCFEKKISDFEVKISKSKFEKKESALTVHKLQVENKLWNKKVNGLEAKLYARGQTDQTIFLNAPNEEAHVKEKWGLAFENPHYLKKAIRKQPALYNFDFLAVAVLKNIVLQSKSTKCSTVSKTPQTSSDNFDDLFASANDFLNSNDGCIEEIEMFDFNAPLPDHSTCLINGKVLPSVLKTDESSTKVGDPVSVIVEYYSKSKKYKKQQSQKRINTSKQKNTQSQKSDFPNQSKSFVSDVRKKRSKARSEWRPKRKNDETAESISDNS